VNGLLSFKLLKLSSSLLMRSGTPQLFVPVTPLQVQGGLPMVKIAFVLAAAALTTAPPFTPAKAHRLTKPT
jgi:hypothetical protein